MLSNILSIIGGITAFAGLIFVVALFERRWGRGYLGAKQSTQHHLSETEATAYRNRF
jgi:hypothetical protein